MAFGFSGSETKTQMLGGDAVVAYINDYLTFTEDYKLTAHSPVRGSRAPIGVSHPYRGGGGVSYVPVRGSSTYTHRSITVL